MWTVDDVAQLRSLLANDVDEISVVSNQPVVLKRELEALRDEAGCFCIAGICAEARGFGAKSKAMDIDDNVL